MKYFKIFLSAFLAGIVFSVGAIASLELSLSSKIASAIIFAGCILIMFNLRLRFFDGKIGYLFTDSKKASNRFFKCCITLVGNAVGVAACGLAFSLVYKNLARAVVVEMLSVSWASVLLKGIIAGMLLFACAHCYRRHNGNLLGNAIAFIGAFTVGACGFVHAISNLFFFAASFRFTPDVLFYTLVGLAGNVFGAIVFAELYEAKKSADDEHYSKSHHHSHSENK